MNERALARTCDSGDRNEHAERYVDVHVLQVVGGGSTDLECTVGVAHRLLERSPVVQVLACECVGLAQFVQRALKDDLPAVRPRFGTEVDDLVGNRDHLRLVLDHQHGVSLVAQLDQEIVHPVDVVRVQADRRLVEDVRDVRER